MMEPGKLKRYAARSKWLDKDSFPSVKIDSGALIKEDFFLALIKEDFITH